MLLTTKTTSFAAERRLVEPTIVEVRYGYMAIQMAVKSRQHPGWGLGRSDHSASCIWSASTAFSHRAMY